MVEIVVKRENEKEKWYMSRRVHASMLTFLATIAITIAPDNYEIISQMCMLIASVLGLYSWAVPKK